MNKKEILRLKKYFYIIGVIFLNFFLLGFLYNYFFPEETKFFFSELTREFSFINNFNFPFTFLFIFFNNTIKVFISMITGLLFGVIPVLFTIINGFVLGVVSGYIYPQLGVTGLLISILPHGIFELFSLFIGSGSGLFLGVVAYKEIKEKRLTFKTLLADLKKFKFTNNKIKKAFNIVIDIFIYLALPGLLLAALIETMLIFSL
jgi:stage II sporulation protein M